VVIAAAAASSGRPDATVWPEAPVKAQVNPTERAARAERKDMEGLLG
jgi:hypothetical protein